jgi:nicotinamide riboside kinase
MKSIAFTGSHATGKSTLIRHFVEHHSRLHICVIEGITRAIISRGFPLAKDSNVDSYTNYIKDQLRSARMLRIEQPDILISNRTVLDAAAYARVNSSLPRPFVPEYFIEMLFEIALLEAKQFDLFIYCPVEFLMEPDEVRPNDEVYREKVGAQIRAFLVENTIPFVEVSGDATSRLTQVNEIIENLNE